MRTYGLIFPHDLAPSKRRFLALSPCGFALFIASPINHGGGACRCGGTLTWRKIRGQPVRTKLPLTPQGERLAKQGRRGRSSLLPTLQEVKFTSIAMSLTATWTCPLPRMIEPPRSERVCPPCRRRLLFRAYLAMAFLKNFLGDQVSCWMFVHDVRVLCDVHPAFARLGQCTTHAASDCPPCVDAATRRGLYSRRFRSGVFVSFSRSQECISSRSLPSFLLYPPWNCLAGLVARYAPAC